MSKRGKKEKPDAYWKAYLKKDVYEVLRQGKTEEPNSGKYVDTVSSGTYLCAGCRESVLSSHAKVESDSGYATFQVSEDDDAVNIVRTYSQTGDALTSITCAACGSRLGTVDDTELRSADDLENSTRNRLVHVNSAAVLLKKGLTPRNYPIGYLIILAALVAGGMFAWGWAGALLDSLRYGDTDQAIHLWIGDDEIEATTVRLSDIDPREQSLLLGRDALFIALSANADAPRLRLSNQEVDILWLDDFYRVILGEQNTDTGDILQQPDNAVFALVVRKGQLPDSVFVEGFEIVVANKSELL